MRGETTRHPADGLSPRQRLAANLIASGLNNEEIAKRCGVSVYTISTYRRDPRVADAVYRAQNEILTQVGGKTLESVLDAIQILRNIMTDPNARDSDRISACRTIIAGSSTFTEHRALERQINEIESMLRKYLGLPADAPLPEDETLIDIVPEPADALPPAIDPEDA